MNEEKILSLLKDIKSDVASVHATMATKVDLGELQSDVSILKSDVTELKTTQQKIVQKIVEHDERFDRIDDTMATKDDINRLTSSIENLAAVVKQVREDQLFVIEWIKRLQTQVDDQQKVIDRQAEEIRQIKLHLQLV